LISMAWTLLFMPWNSVSKRIEKMNYNHWLIQCGYLEEILHI
jgi:hypothetical protein